MIPRLIFRTVPAETTDQVERWWLTAHDVHPGWMFTTYREPLDPADFPITAHLWDRCLAPAQKAGLVRLELLARHGGCYLDSDVECYRPLTPLLGVEAFAGWEDARCVPDAVLGAVEAHPAIVACLARAVALLEHPDPAESAARQIWLSGPGVTTAVLPGRPDVLLLPPGSLYPYHYSAKDRDRGRDHRTEQPWCFAAHHWAHGWADA